MLKKIMVRVLREMNNEDECLILHSMKECGENMDNGDIENAKSSLDNMFDKLKKPKKKKKNWFRLWFKKNIIGIVFRKEF